VRPTGVALAIAAVIAATVPELPTTLVASTEEIRDPVSQSLNAADSRSASVTRRATAYAAGARRIRTF